MDKLQLALLTSWAEEEGLRGIQGRKRMQKVIYFLQQVGCPIDADYTLHHYGPYSREVANVSDIMVAEGLLNEQGGNGEQYAYTLGSQTKMMLDQIGQSENAESFQKFRPQAIELLRTDLWKLELGSTILYFYRSGRTKHNWESALREACTYKKADFLNPASQAALDLAKRFASGAA